MNTKRLLFLSLIALAMAGMVFAGNPEKSGTAAGQELLIPIGARGTALAGSGIASISGVEALYYNPAGIAASGQSVETMFSHMRYIADINLTNLAVAANVGFGTLAFSFQNVGFGDIEQTTESAPDGTGVLFTPTYFTISGAFSRAMTDRIHAGVAVKLISEKIMGMKANGVALDMGVQYRHASGINLGIALKNYGTGMKFNGGDVERLVTLPNTEPGTPNRRLSVPTQRDEFPSTFEMGLSYDVVPMEKTNLLIMANFLNHNFGNDQVQGGAELSFNNMFFLRGGYSFGTNQTKYEGESDYIWGPSFGGGLRYNLGGTTSIVLDYAYRTANFFTDNNIFTFKIEF
ncbi:MAG TPA: PorV/PorQ family protein [bacterium]|nr:PorV/PorQ family protein [bacterium]HPN34138.1 PorV/PorQ family protein [bacterium]